MISRTSNIIHLSPNYTEEDNTDLDNGIFLELPEFEGTDYRKLKNIIDNNIQEAGLVSINNIFKLINEILEIKDIFKTISQEIKEENNIENESDFTSKIQDTDILSKIKDHINDKKGENKKEALEKVLNFLFSLDKNNALENFVFSFIYNSTVITKKDGKNIESKPYDKKEMAELEYENHYIIILFFIKKYLSFFLQGKYIVRTLASFIK